ncbi:MAG TPA: leishmanolysin-related zinc metalloendopeptidase [Gemmatimonadaceae bacterium]
MVAGRRFVRSGTTALVRLAAVAGLAACGDEPTSATAPFVIEASLSGEPDVVVGTIVTPTPAFVVRNAKGDALVNVPVTITITKGDGTLANAPLRTVAGLTPVGDWTLDTIARLNEITITVGSAPPAKISLVGMAGPATSVSADAKTLDALAGDFLSSLFTLRVRDRYGNPVGRAGIDLSVAKGGGEVSPPTLTTDDHGIASGITWRLGRLGGSQQLVATVGTLRAEIAASIRSAFDPIVRSTGPSLPAPVTAALAAAIDRIHAGIVGDLGDVPVLNFDMSRCGLQGTTITETIDDLLIFAIVTPIDGVGKVLASAGPCVLRTQSRFPVIGIMRFDSDDIEALSSNGRLSAVVLHEMLHVIGIGSLWRTHDMVIGATTSDPRFIGVLAAGQCITSGGFGNCSDSRVPVENVGGSGTADVHWRESVFDREVMTGFVEANADMPFSSISIASLQDLGYVVNLLTADPFQVPIPGAISPRLSPQVVAPWELPTQPVFEITTAGWVRPIVLR